MKSTRVIRILLYVMIVETIMLACFAGVEGFLMMLSMTLTYAGLVELAFKHS